MRWNCNDKRHSNKHKGGQDKFRDSDTTSKASKSGTKKSKKHQDPTIPSEDNGDSQFECSMDDCHFRRGSSVLSRTASKRSHTPTPSLQRTGSQSASNGKMDSFRRSMSTRATTSTANSSSSSENPTNSKNVSKLLSQRSMKSPTAATIANVASLSKSTSRRSTTPIIFSQSTARRNAQPIEMKLECSLEELCFGALKQVKINKDVISDAGMIVQEEETLEVDIKPGFKPGTKITFEGKGDEKPGYLPADIVFLIEEKRHMFKRIGDDLELGVRVPLLKALVGCNITVPLLGGEKMNLVFDDVIHPGYEKIIPNQGMPKGVGGRGDLRLNFLVDFPRQLTDIQRSNICTILQGCFLSENN
ncbi:hypothetical protein Cgig2_003636 [Carnegiea gigantea]|uniref:Chaperone DnaJ C-terminal domain-containing protein n=1 Tax=Carnegiea gigantea TaxID=171969 RepID=A0A9Q1GYA4_9CARY|nr:hypothetical protein Cgig2_003636 [Carnegiea gigantea]